MAETVSAIVSRQRSGGAVPMLCVGLAGDTPDDPPIRASLLGVDRVDLGRGEHRSMERTMVDGVATITVSLPDARLSSRHARLIHGDDGWWIEDLQSKNGTWVGGSRVTRRHLADSDAILVGHTMLVFRDCGGEAGDLVAPRPAQAGLATMSPYLDAQFAALVNAARSNVPIEITGETGTGKELVARAIHEHSGRSGAFVAVNCGALPPSLVEGELFGHRKGAFTGAGVDRMGLVRSAEGGTLFLDEVAEIPSASQAALLRVLQEREVVPLGADRPVAVDVRVVTATHRSLDDEVAANRFRADLRARLLGFPLALPALRDRLEDLSLVVAAVLGRVAPGRRLAFTADAAMALYACDWPLNIRQLERTLAAAAAAVTTDRIEVHHLPAAIREPRSFVEPSALSPEDRELRDRLSAAFQRHDGNLSAVARELDKDRTQIRRWVKRLGLDRA